MSRAEHRSHLEVLAPTLIGWKLNTVCEREPAEHSPASCFGTPDVRGEADRRFAVDVKGSVAQLVRAPS